MFLELLESTPSLFPNTSQAIAGAVSRLATSGFFELQGLAADFVSVSNDSCDISLSQELISNVTALYESALITFFFFRSECDILNQTLVEEAIADADVSVTVNSLSFELFEIDGASRLAIRTGGLIGDVLTAAPGDILTTAQTGVDDFLFFVNDFCDIPLSDVARDQLNVYFLVDLANFAINNP